jgi:sugar phosphate isomerase/epimerase
MATSIGAQLYTVREYCKTSPDFAATLNKLRKIGYQAVQVSAVGVKDGKEVARILDGEGMVCAATHQNLQQLKDTAACLDYHQTIKCKLTAIGGYFNQEGFTVQNCSDFARDLSQAADNLSKGGLAVGYHNHSHELAKLENGQLMIDLLLEKLSKSVWFEIDTYWITHGGGDPAAWIERLAGRLPAVHLKDMSITFAREQKMSEVGSGNLNWPRILQACKSAKVHWYLVERDAGDLDPFESLKISYNNLRAMGLS